ncbi:flagellar hook-basal body complex protein FliE [uncultured Paludibaculum sp.]|uniref:flagellar hook-basal body complex protein FliE n=1 Tax=uncultured Paludibaculum sp. TaxID=1765020 RepID=UPI002AABD9ED|nr:flagellar hook-basal body complex protein FliE [uncultured Paludibaculum sp.]
MIPPVTSMANIPGIDGASGLGSTRSVQPTGPASPEFGNMLEAAIDRVELSRNTAQDAVKQFVSGDEGEIHSTVMAVQRAELDFELALQVKNKVVSAYQEIMRMQI